MTLTVGPLRIHLFLLLLWTVWPVSMVIQSRPLSLTVSSTFSSLLCLFMFVCVCVCLTPSLLTCWDRLDVFQWSLVTLKAHRQMNGFHQCTVCTYVGLLSGSAPWLYSVPVHQPEANRGHGSWTLILWAWIYAYRDIWEWTDNLKKITHADTHEMHTNIQNWTIQRTNTFFI